MTYRRLSKSSLKVQLLMMCNVMAILQVCPDPILLKWCLGTLEIYKQFQ